MTHSNPYNRYAEQAGNVARQMLDEPDNTPVTFGNGVPGSLALFKWAGTHVHRQTINRLGESVPPMFKRRNVLYGMLVMSRFVYMTARTAHARGLEADTYVNALMHPSTFAQTLGEFATRDNLLAEELETSYGLRGSLPLSVTSTHYAFERNGSIGLRDLDRLSRGHRAILEAEGGVIRDDVVCAAHRAEALEGVFGAVAPSYATHPALGGAIFAGSDVAAALPPGLRPELVSAH